ncbi:MAG: hypothetical protein H0V82_12965 [Candidatus Protochlamydia sp.]|nr:hypothetical protein [Candidatus Protochlamydia sp.]
MELILQILTYQAQKFTLVNYTRQADFSSASRYSIDPQTNKNKKAKFSLAKAVGLLRSFDIILYY